MQRKCAAIVKTVNFFTQPMRCVFTGPVGPLYQLKSIAVFHLGTKGSATPPSVLSWKTQLLERDLGHIVMIDTPMQHAHDINNIVCKLKVPGSLGWDSARRSPAHSVEIPRQVFCGYFCKELVSVMDLALIIKHIRGQISFAGVHIGSQGLFHENSCLIVEYGDVQALEPLAHLTQETVIVSKRKALITTLAPKELFEPVLTHHMQTSPLHSVSCIRFRKSLNLSNNVWMKPALTGLQVDKARQQAIAAKKAPKESAALALKARLCVEGLTHVEHVSVCQELMKKVNEVTSLPLTQASGDTIAANEWAINYKLDGSFAQQINIQLCSEEALKMLLMHVQGCGIRIGGRNLSVEVRSGHAAADFAGMSACNLVTGDGGPCL